MANDLRDESCIVTMADAAFTIGKDGEVTEMTAKGKGEFAYGGSVSAVLNGDVYTLADDGRFRITARIRPSEADVVIGFQEAMKHATPGMLVRPSDDYRSKYDAANQRANALADRVQGLEDDVKRLTRERDGLELRLRRMGGK